MGRVPAPKEPRPSLASYLLPMHIRLDASPEDWAWFIRELERLVEKHPR